MPPRTTRAAKRRAREAAQEFKEQDPDPADVVEQQTRIRTPQKPRDTTEPLSGSFLSSAGRSASALAARLTRTYEALQHLSSSQQQRDDGVLDARAAARLRLVAAELLQPFVLSHKDNSVRTLVACCLVELLRVSAPDSPLDDEEDLYKVFKLLVSQLRALAPRATASSLQIQSLHVLESLAAGKACALLVGLAFKEQEEESMVVQLFKALFETLTEDHSAKIKNLMLSIMVTCIEESDEVEQPLMDVILRPLLDDSGSEEETAKTGAAHMARELIRRTSELLQSPLANFFNNILVDAPRLSAQTVSELKEHVHTLIFEVHKVNPSLLLYVLPNVCLQLQVDEVATRADAIALMGKLFASSHADYGHQYTKNFRDFLGRFRDASKEIRLQMVQVSVSIWAHKPELAGLLEQELILRLSDPEWEVRQLVVHELCDFAANCLDLISEECLRAVGERMKDKKVTLRKETMTGLCQVFSTHISSYWEEEDGDEDRPLSLSHRNIPAAHVKKLGWIPDYVLKCYAYPQQELKLRVVQLLDDFLLPKGLSERTRANGLLFIYHLLDAASKEALRRVFNERAKCQQACLKFAHFKAQHRQKGRATEADDGELDTAKQQLYAGLSPLFSDVGSLKKLLAKLAKWKDHSVFKHLRELCDFSMSQREYRHARDQLVRSVGSKSPLGEFLKKLCRKLSLLTMSQASVSALLDFLVAKEGRPTRENRSVVDLLVMASGELPELFAPFVREKAAAILVEGTGESAANPSATSDEEDEEEPVLKDPRVVLGALHILANYSQHWAASGCGDDASMEDDESSTPSAELAEQLHKFCLGDSDVEGQNLNAAKESRAAELAAFAIAHFYGKADETKQLIQKLCSAEKLGSPRSSGALPALQSLEVFAKRCSHVFSQDASLFSGLWTHLLNDLVGEGEQVPAPGTPGAKERQKGGRPAAVKLAEVRCLAIKVAVNLLVFCRPTGSLSTIREGGAKLVKLLFGVLRADGKTYGSTPALAAAFRATASCGLMKLMRNRQLEASVSVSEWHLLGLTMQDASEDVRRKFLKKLASHVMKQPVQYPHKYLSYLALAATDSSSSVKKAAGNLLKMAVERMRRMFDAACSRESELASPGPGSGAPGLSALMVPEYSLPYVVHLLAHHPAFPVKLVERSPTVLVLRSALWTDQLAYLGFYLDALVSANAAAADNIAFLLQMLTKLSQCHDVASPEDINLYPLIDSAVALLKKKIKKQSNLKPFPGKIFLPKHLYSPGRPASLATQGGRKEPEAPESLGTAADARGPRLGTSLSPIKPMDFAAHFMRLNSPPGSSLKSSGPKRKRSSLPAEGEEKREDNEEDETMQTPPRRESLLGKARPQVRTFADDSSDSGAESDAFLSQGSASYRAGKAQLHQPASAASSVHSAGSGQAPIAEEKEEEEPSEPPAKKHTSYEKPRLRSARRQQT